MVSSKIAEEQEEGAPPSANEGKSRDQMEWHTAMV